MDPDMGFQVAGGIEDISMSEVKRTKLETNLRHAAEDYRAGRFERAESWYRGALQLAPGREDIRASFQNAQRMRQAQDQALEKLPRRARDRAKYLETTFEQAEQWVDSGDYDKAREVYYEIWVAVGDFNGKVLDGYRNSAKLLASAGDQSSVEELKAGIANDVKADSIPATLDFYADQKNIDEEVIKARAMMRMGYLDDARRYLDGVLRTDAKNLAAQQAMRDLDRLSMQDQLHGRMIAQVGNTAEDDEKIIESYTVLEEARRFYYSQNYENALTKIAEALRIWPGNQSAVDLREEIQRLQNGEDAVVPAVPEQPAATPQPTAQPTPEPTAQPTPQPTAEPTPEPTAQPTPQPTAQPTAEPTPEPTPRPTLDESPVVLEPIQAQPSEPDTIELTPITIQEPVVEDEQTTTEEPAAMESEPVVVESAETTEDTPTSDAAAMDSTQEPAVMSTDSEPEVIYSEEESDTAVAATEETAPSGLSAAEQEQISALHSEARVAYDRGDLETARARWEEVLTINPGNGLAETWLEMTAREYAELVSSRGQEAEAASLQEQARKLLSAPIRIATDRKVSLEDFMNAISFATPVELQYYIAEGAEANIYANFVDKPLSEVLDTVLKPIGLEWYMDDKNVIVIQPKLVSITKTLNPQQISKLRELLDSGELQRIIWGQVEPPAKGVNLTLNERQNILIVTGSEQHIEKINSFIPTLSSAVTPDLVVRIYKIREDDGPRIKSLINSIISASEISVFELERKVLVDGNDLIIRDTPENITKIEDLLLDQQFIQNLRNEELTIELFNLIPRDVETATDDQLQTFTARVVEAIKVFLYSQEGERAAAEKGRQLWFDEDTFQLTIVDTPSNLQRVREYVESLPQLGERASQKIVFLQFQVATDIAPEISRILELTGSDVAAGGTGQEVIVQLRRGDERTIFDNIRLRVLRVEENDEDDRSDDTVELNINLPGLGPQNTTLQELDSQLVDNYEFTAEDVLPSSNAGEGSARIRIRAVGQVGSQVQLQQQQAIQQQIAAQTTGAQEEDGLTINPFGNLNALIFRYTDPQLFRDAVDLLDQLDIPTKQVKIETKFVEVNETRAKEFSADFSISGLGSGTISDLFSDPIAQTRFAQNQDEFRDQFSPPIENPNNANLIKGTTVLSAVFGSFPQLQYNLRLLEAEGIVNVVNGPQVLSLNNEEAEFRIEQTVPDDEIDLPANALAEIVNPFDAIADVELADQDEATQDDGLLTAVVLRMTPSITSNESIILNDLSAELIDFDGWLGSLLAPIVNAPPGTEDDFFTLVDTPVGIVNTSQMLTKRKKILTSARIKNGGTIVIGGWTGERTEEFGSGIPVLRNLPYVGKLLFSRNQRTRQRTTLLIFLTGNLVE